MMVTKADFKQLTQSIEDLKNDFKSFKETLTNVEKSNTKLCETVKETAEKIKTFDHRLDDVDSHCKLLQQKYDELSQRVIYMEAQSRRDNLIIDGIAEPKTKETESDCLEKVYDVLISTMGIENARDFRIVRCHRVGPPPNSGSKNPKPRSVIFKLHWFRDRQTIWQKRTSLKHSQYFLKEDYPKEIVAKRKKLYPVMLAAQQHKCVSYITLDKLHVIHENDGHMTFDVDSLHRLPPYCDPRFGTTRRSEETMVFFREPCPLSNFHPCSFVIEGQRYHSSEQYFQYKKAQLAKDEPSMNKILTAKTASACKYFGDNVRISNSVWYKNNLTIMKQALHAKFSQNDSLKDFLLLTGNMRLGEASPRDKYWGIGIGLGDKDVLTKQWPGKNHLGHLLMELRTTLK
jgi:ribA/ribD-fused uncharacterized protein